MDEERLIADARPALPPVRASPVHSLGPSPGHSPADSPRGPPSPTLSDGSAVMVNFSNLSDVERKSTAADIVHAAFLYLSVPITIGTAIAAGVLYGMHHIEAHTVSRAVAGICTGATVLLTTLLVYMHLTAYTNPRQQRLIVRILLMCPIYAVDSLVGLCAYRYATVVNLVRDTYEAYVIYMFFRLLMEYLGGEEMTVREWKRTKPTMPHLFPLCFLPHLTLDTFWLNTWKLMLLQYMVINPLLTLVAVPLYFTGYYTDGKLSPTDSYAWFSAIRFVSVTLAFTSLVYFYFASQHLLADHKPMPKFAAIKTVVFLSFWQTVLLSGLNHFHVIPPSRQHLWTRDQVTTALGNFVLCLEMYLITIAHRWIFSDVPYIPNSGRGRVTLWALRHAFTVSDVVQETRSTVQLVPELVPQAAAAVRDVVPSPLRRKEKRSDGSPNTTATADDVILDEELADSTKHDAECSSSSATAAEE